MMSDSVESQAHEAMIELSNHRQQFWAVMNQTQPEIWVKDLRTKGKCTSNYMPHGDYDVV